MDCSTVPFMPGFNALRFAVAAATEMMRSGIQLDRLTTDMHDVPR